MISDSSYLVFNVNALSSASMASNQTSISYDASTSFHYAVQSVWTGASPVGTIEVQASLDGLNWGNIYTVAVASNSGSDIHDLGSLAFPYLRVAYAFTSGTGLLNVKLCAKG